MNLRAFGDCVSALGNRMVCIVTSLQGMLVQAHVDDEDISMLLPIPHKDASHKLYSWAYYRYETIGRRQGLEGEALKHLCRTKANIVKNMGLQGLA